MKHPVLNAETRTILGKKVKQLRKLGLLPANVYGKGLSSKSLQVKISDFQDIFKQVGETGLIELNVDKKTHPVLIKSVQIDYIKNNPIHADFYQVNLKEKVKAMVPIELTGEAKAVTEKIGILLQTLSEVEIEALPEKIPDHIKVNVEHLAEIGAGITTGELKIEEGVILLTDQDITIAKIAEPAKEEPVEAVEEVPAEGTASEEKDNNETKPEEKTQEAEKK